MPYYRVIIKGYNFPGQKLGKPKKRYGLYTTHWVEALDPQDAEQKAVHRAWNDPKLAIPYPKRPEDRAWLKVEKIQKIAKLPRFQGGGAIWFEE